jgi:hypothetical protein
MKLSNQFFRFLSSLYRQPLRSQFFIAFNRKFLENVRMPADEFGSHGLQYLGERKNPLPVIDL